MRVMHIFFIRMQKQPLKRFAHTETFFDFNRISSFSWNNKRDAIVPSKDTEIIARAE